MLLPLLFFILLFAVAFFQSTQGLFSALIMMILTLCCATVAFGSYEWVADYLLAIYWKPDFAHPLALGLIFGLSLLLLRLIFDKAVRRSCLLPAMVDRVGAGICGFITSMVMVGMMAACLQMIPFGESILGYTRFDLALSRSGQSPPEPHAAERNLWFQPDRFAAETAGLLSSGIFSHSRNLYQDHPDPIQAAGWVNTVHHEVSRYAKPNSIGVVSSEPLQFVYRFISGDERKNIAELYDPISPDGSNVFQMIRVKLKQGARDERKNHAFTLRQFRLAGRDGPDGRWMQYYPIAIQQEDSTQSINRHIRYKKGRRGDWPVIDEIFAPRRDNDNQVEIVFDLPKRFIPSFLEYKRSARIFVQFSKERAEQKTDAQKDRSVRSASSLSPATTPQIQTTTEKASADRGSNTSRRSSRRSRGSRSQESVPDSGRGGNVRGFTTQADRSFFGDPLPFEMRSYRAIKNPEIRRGKLVSGHLIGEVDQQESGRDRPISRFDVPRDMRLLHLHTSALQSRSGLGRALSKTVAVAQNYIVEDSNGRPYRFVGKYAVASVAGKDIIEIQYFPDQAGTVGGVGAFDKINEGKLKSGDQVVLLFLVEPGAQIVSFSTGGAATRRDDLRNENLVAPQ